MLKPEEITQPGAYWYHTGGDRQLVQIKAGQAGLEIHFKGRDDYDMLDDVAGEFEIAGESPG